MSKGVAFLEELEDLLYEIDSLHRGLCKTEESYPDIASSHAQVEVELLNAYKSIESAIQSIKDL